MDGIRFGILGCGNIAGRFARALQKSDAASLYACAAREESRAQAFAAEHGATRAYGDYQALIDDPRVQAVYIATVHTAHARWAKACLRAGKPVLCEKPFFTNGREAEEVAALAREQGVLTMEAFWTACLPAYRKAKEWIDAGRIGRVRLIRADFCYRMPFTEALRHHRIWDPAQAGGALLDVGVYPYEFAAGLLGAPETFTSTVIRGETGVDAATAFTMTWPDGALAQCLCSVEAGMDDGAQISGTAGSIRMPRFYGARKCTLCDAQGKPVEEFSDPEEEGFVHEIAHFAALLREGKKESDSLPLSGAVEFAHRADQALRGVSIRPMEPEDGAAMARLLRSADIGRTYLLPGPLDEEGAKALFARFLGEDDLKGGRYVRAILRGGRLAGWLNAVGAEKDGTLEIGYAVDPAQWNRGVCTQALALALRELFDRGVPRVRCGYFEENTASRRVMEKCGLTPTGREERLTWQGTEHRVIYCEIQSPRSKDQ